MLRYHTHSENTDSKINLSIRNDIIMSFEYDGSGYGPEI